MPKIKVEKEMNLGELLCWAIENKKQAKYRDFRSESIRVRFNGSGLPQIIFDKQFLPIYETFIVRTKEPITEDTKLFLISRCIGKLGNVNYLYGRTTINRRLENLPEDCKITHIYVENEYKELVLIWENGKLVE